jgi:hypothetical protein
VTLSAVWKVDLSVFKGRDFLLDFSATRDWLAINGILQVHLSGDLSCWHQVLSANLWQLPQTNRFSLTLNTNVRQTNVDLENAIYLRFQHVIPPSSYRQADGLLCLDDIQLIEQPSLTITRFASGLSRLSWPKPSAGWLCEENTDLSSGTWRPVSALISEDEARFYIDISSSYPQQFFRLTHQ